jgi:hypothetical protein
MPQPTLSAVPLRAVLAASCAIVAAAPALAAPTVAVGTLYVARSVYASKPSTIVVGQALPDTNGAKATNDATYPTVFANDSVDPNFGITAPIELYAYKVINNAKGLRAGGVIGRVNVTTPTSVVTSFSSKSELGLQLSTDASAITFMGYSARLGAIDVSNTDTPDHVDPTNTDSASPTYRTVVQYNLHDGSFVTTPTDTYSGNNGRAAVLARNANGSGSDEYLIVGNAGNGSGIEPNFIVNDTGVQSVVPGAGPATTVIGAQQGTPGSKNGFEYGFSVASLGDPADKSGKDDNFRGETVFGNTLYVSKGSGSNGVNTVYQVGTAGTLPTPSTATTTQITVLPGFPTNLASAISETKPATEFYPFGLWFANATTLYVADEGSQDLNADPQAGLQKWTFDGTKWNLAYVIQAGLNLDQPYSVLGYSSTYNPATTGLRHLTGVVHGDSVTIFATTSTYSSLPDPGADPNQLVTITDKLSATTQPGNEAFTVLSPPYAKVVYRGVAFVPAQ